MALKNYNPVTPSLRGTILVNRAELWKGKPVKTLTEGKVGSGGRNNHGRITTRFRGGGHKQAYRYVDFKRRKYDVQAKVERLEDVPKPTGLIAVIKYQDGGLSCIHAPPRVPVGAPVRFGVRAALKSGNAIPLSA